MSEFPEEIIIIEDSDAAETSPDTQENFPKEDINKKEKKASYFRCCWVSFIYHNHTYFHSHF